MSVSQGGYNLSLVDLSPAEGKFEGFPGGSKVKASACKVGDPSSIPGLGRSPGEENGNPFQLQSMESQSQTQLSD